MEITTLHEFAGTYGGPAARDEILRALKEALALVEYTAGDAELACPGWRIEILLGDRSLG